MQRGRVASTAIVAGLAAVQKDGGNTRLITIWASEADRVLYVGLLRVDGDALWIDAEPFAVGPDRYFDAKEHDRAAMRGRTSVDGL
ncbi:hypothetical protein O159_00990 [Leifsonia xyli subsp. cynodontis DSM 46306]|jgi:hypothetical protein|uniref:Uncharacterized protein n=1 Tax=Leifsonia xyli subsp. cynodontis DSM 46306 TaxID=1389489 RepID=U3P4M7_LEIXC|nr:hypothetical protein [Leifsonia xyli]AGW40369.1 hypothetical protein O159_00990 [Leifsonia xyli subsp. cynodontis DSM 46306]